MNANDLISGVPFGALDPVDESLPIREIGKKKMMDPSGYPAMESAGVELSPMLG